MAIEALNSVVTYVVAMIELDRLFELDAYLPVSGCPHPSHQQRGDPENEGRAEKKRESKYGVTPAGQGRHRSCRPASTVILLRLFARLFHGLPEQGA